MTFEQWIVKTLEEFSNQNIQRKGQFLYNSLHDENRKIANQICGTEYDPFYIDERIDLFIGYVYLNWEEGKNGTLG